MKLLIIITIIGKMVILPRANDCGFTSDCFGDPDPLRHIILETEAIVENVAGTTLDRIAPTMDLFLSSESLLRKQYQISAARNCKNQR